MSKLTDILTASLYPALKRVMGDAVSYIPDGGDPVAITVLWNEGPGMEDGVQATALVTVDQVATPRKYDRIVKGGKVYQVIGDPARDQNRLGGVLLKLRYVQEVV